MNDTGEADKFTPEEMSDWLERNHDVLPKQDGVSIVPEDAFGVVEEDRRKAESPFAEEPTLGELYDRMSEEDKKKAFFFLFRVADFYADSDTWFATTILSDPPCGSIAHDYRLADDGKHRPGGRARLAIAWICSSFEKLIKRKT